MSQIENNLTKDEEIVAKAEQTMISIIPSIIKSLLVGIIIGLLLLFPIFSILMYKLKLIHVIATILIPAILTPALYALKDILTIKSTELAVTTKKIFGKTGIINTKIMDAPLNKINNITVEQNLSGKLFGFGKVVITTSSGNYNFPFIKNADSFRRVVMNQIDIYDNERVKKQAEELTRSMANG
ncbi:MAG: PH domain-containing protein [Ruminiclostridium sp.]|nr:PH domain-containing protein [Ruminiclostridium sp.]